MQSIIAHNPAATTQLFRTSNLIRPGYYAALLFTVVLFVFLFSQPTREGLVIELHTAPNSGVNMILVFTDSGNFICKGKAEVTSFKWEGLRKALHAPFILSLYQLPYCSFISNLLLNTPDSLFPIFMLFSFF